MTNCYRELVSHADPTTKLPLMDSPTFKGCTKKYTKEVFRESLAEYIATERPTYPLKAITYEKMRQTFQSLANLDSRSSRDKRNSPETICVPVDQLSQEVVEKYDDYKYPFSEWGRGVIQGASTYNDASDYFHQHLRLHCSSYNFRGSKEVWENGTAKDIWKIFGALWRGVNSTQDLSEKSYREAIRLGTYIATQFKPVVAKVIYDLIQASVVLDTSCGWGDRLCGFYASGADFYIGCDPNPNTFEQYKRQVVEYEKMMGKVTPTIKESPSMWSYTGKKKVLLFRCGAENLPWSDLPPVDMAFTSPPYFSTERYNEGGKHQDDQSWHKFTQYEMWRDLFFLPVAEKSMKLSRYMFVNIMDPKIKGVRYRSCDELVDHLRDQFMGQLGMKIMRRPKSDTLFKNEDEKRKHAADTFIENVWCFTNQQPKPDLFGHMRKTSLESFMV